MTKCSSLPWSIAYCVCGTVFNTLGGFLTCVNGSLAWINENVIAPQCEPINTASSNSVCWTCINCSKWIWIFTWITVLSLLQVGFTEGVTTPSGSVCSETFRSAGQIHVDGEAQSLGEGVGGGGGGGSSYRCNVFIEAPNRDVIKLNFTNIYGFTPSAPQSKSQPLQPTSSESSMLSSLPTSAASKHTVAAAPAPPPSPSSSRPSQLPLQPCTPRVDITEVTSSGRERLIDTLCRQHSNLQAPQVFQSYTHLIKLTFEWPPGHGHVGFNLDFTFAKKQGRCEFECADRTCLPDTSLVCNGIADCLDSSDEFQCTPSAGPPRNSTANNKLLQVIVIVVVVILMVFVIACIVNQYRSTSRGRRSSHHLWRPSGSTSHRESSSEHSQLRPHTPQTSEVVYFAGSEYEREMALAREREQTLRSLPAGISDLGGDVLNLPVSVPLSLDGEEGYRAAQQRLIHQHYTGCDREVNQESIHPPPNRTVYDGESPPPYRARRFTHPTGGSGADSKHADRSASAAKMPTQVITGNGGSPVVRCYNGGLSNNNNTNNVNLNSSACLGGGGGAHPQYQYHPPHAYHPRTNTAGHNGHLRAPPSNHNHRRESPTAASVAAAQPSSGHSRHSSGSSSNSARSSLGSPPNYDDVIANKFTSKHSGSDV